MFHVPEQYRHRTGVMGSDASAGNHGVFIIPSPTIKGRELVIIASDGHDWTASGLDGEPWEHVSVHAVSSRLELTPTWLEMSFVKDTFWDDDDYVVQLHPPKSVYINVHPNTLHLWRPTITVLPLPPLITV